MIHHLHNPLYLHATAQTRRIASLPMVICRADNRNPSLVGVLLHRRMRRYPAFMLMIEMYRLFPGSKGADMETLFVVMICVLIGLALGARGSAQPPND